GQLGRSTVRLGPGGNAPALNVGGVTVAPAPSVSPAYVGVGYIIGPRLAALNFSGGLFAWGLMIPMLIYFLGPQLQNFLPPGPAEAGAWEGLANQVWRYIVRPIAVCGMIASLNTPLSGLTLSTLIMAALLLVTLGVSGAPGVVAVLGDAAVVCVSAAVAGDLLQDFKVGYILGGTPRTTPIAELIAVV